MNTGKWKMKQSDERIRRAWMCYLDTARSESKTERVMGRKTS
jgi:hypothetical protein